MPGKITNRRRGLVALVLVAMPLTMANSRCSTSDGGTTSAPKEGVVQQVVPGSGACLDQGANTTGVTYQPDGKDQTGTAWPLALACVTPEVGQQLTKGGRFQQ